MKTLCATPSVTEDFPLDPPTALDQLRSHEELLCELVEALEKDEIVGKKWGLPMRLIQRQKAWRRERYFDLMRDSK